MGGGEVSMINKKPDWDAVSRKLPILISEFSKIINKESLDAALCIPDFLIAEYLVDQLRTLSFLNKKTETWSNE